MKKIFALFLTAATFTAVTTMSSCTKTCDAGYEGSDCKTEIRSKYTGTYKVSGTATNTSGTAPITDLIVTVANSSSSVTKFNLSYTLGGDTYSLVGDLDDNGSFTIASQTAQGLTYSGSGSFTTSSMTLNLTEVDGSTTTNISLTGPKQ